MTRRLRPRHFAAKLRITATLFRCDSQKALDALFRDADPETAFDLARSYKWTQGRSVPRATKLYEEWARLLDTGDTAEWLCGCGIDAFVAALADRHGADRDTLHAAAGPQGQSEGVSNAGDDYICGRYALYLRAQSPYYAESLIRGSLEIEASGRPGSYIGRIEQSFAGITASASGPAVRTPNGLVVELWNETGSVGPAFLLMFRPTPPASLIAGLMSSFVALHAGGQPPYSSRAVLVRAARSDPGSLERGNRYLENEEALASDLSELGLPIAEAPELPEMIARWLSTTDDAVPGAINLSSGAHLPLVNICDRLWLRALERNGCSMQDRAVELLGD